MTNVIELKNVGKSYDNGETTVINEMNLQIQEKDFVVFVGPSGCGKSTTLRMIAGLESITSGDLLMNGKKMNDVPPKDRDISMVFQNYALFPHLTVYDNIAFALKIKKVNKQTIQQKVEYAANVLGLNDYLTRKPKDLSGGQQQRVALGRAIVGENAFFLMDEPLSNLDANLRTAMREELSSLHQQLGKTTIYVTHDQTEAMTMADKIVVLNKGDIQQVGTPTEIYDTPVNLFVADFIGSPKMNFINVTVDKQILKIASGIPVGRINAPEYEGKELKMGIRPEHIIQSFDSKGLLVTVDFNEMLGSESHLHTNFHGQKITLKLPRSNSKNGDQLYIEFNASNIHLFDMDTELRLPISVGEVNE